MQKLIKKSDIILIICLGLILVLFLLFRSYKSKTQKNELIAEISVKNQIVYTINLSQVEKPYIIQLDSNPTSIVEIEKGRIRYKSSNCPDKICVRTSWLNGNLQSAACLPAKSSIVIKTQEKDKDQADVITY
ncbi:MAG: NusG domain II-containing protein [Clostridia bacterium]|nr:NusG domain II-containing protein [Clostridia bacterium]